MGYGYNREKKGSDNMRKFETGEWVSYDNNEWHITDYSVDQYDHGYYTLQRRRGSQVIVEEVRSDSL